MHGLDFVGSGAVSLIGSADLSATGFSSVDLTGVTGSGTSTINLSSVSHDVHIFAGNGNEVLIGNSALLGGNGGDGVCFDNPSSPITVNINATDINSGSAVLHGGSIITFAHMGDVMGSNDSDVLSFASLVATAALTIDIADDLARIGSFSGPSIDFSNFVTFIGSNGNDVFNIYDYQLAEGISINGHGGSDTLFVNVVEGNSDTVPGEFSHVSGISQVLFSDRGEGDMQITVGMDLLTAGVQTLGLSDSQASNDSLDLSGVTLGSTASLTVNGSDGDDLILGAAGSGTLYYSPSAEDLTIDLSAGHNRLVLNFAEAEAQSQGGENGTFALDADLSNLACAVTIDYVQGTGEDVSTVGLLEIDHAFDASRIDVYGTGYGDTFVGNGSTTVWMHAGAI